MLYSRHLRDTLLDVAAAGLYQCRWSDGILEEFERNLSEGPLGPERSTKLIRAMNNFFPEALIRRSEYEARIEGLTNHPKDRHVLAAAIASDSLIIVTDNTRDFPDQSIEPHGIEVQTADAFLMDMFRRFSVQMLRILNKQASDYPYQLSFEGLIERLSKHAPTFAKAVSETAEQRPTASG
ncbi:MAG: PIN domain-containing protein [Chloroflexi bacterium]|nr:PIN domain-containing protein [Chloroflexota bacterium]